MSDWELCKENIVIFEMVSTSGKRPSPPAEHQLEAVTHLSQQNIHKIAIHKNVPDSVTHVPPGKKQMFIDL